MTEKNNSYEIDVTISEPEWTASFLDVEKLSRNAMELALKMVMLPEKVKHAN